jgi:hypothetical protein
MLCKVDDCGVCVYERARARARVCVCVCVVPKRVNVFQFRLNSDKNDRYSKREVSQTSACVSTFLPPNSLNTRIYQKKRQREETEIAEITKNTHSAPSKIVP